MHIPLMGQVAIWKLLVVVMAVERMIPQKWLVVGIGIVSFFYSLVGGWVGEEWKESITGMELNHVNVTQFSHLG